jgi:cytochrome c oxidase assembly protein subunit 15
MVPGMLPTAPVSNSAPPPPAPLHGLSLLLGHLVVALIALVAIGGATRVMEAGLACPDWPLCYGSLLPGRQMNLQVFLEWFHRLDAFLVGLTLLAVLTLSLLRRRALPVWLPWIAGLALGLVGLQGGLGAFTVLGLLAPGTVTAHLLTALLLVLVVAGCSDAVRALRSRSDTPSIPSLPRWWWPLPVLATSLLFCQCVLGGAMASRWASSLCLESGEACRWLLLHRYGAWGALTALLLLGAASLALPKAHRPVTIRAVAASLLAPLQVLLGVLTLRLQLGAPLVTVAHQLLAALLVAVLGSLWGRALILSSSARAIPASPSFEMAHG